VRRMALWGGFVLALAFLALTITNASWLAPYPAGAPKQIAHRALAPQVRGSWDTDCTATAIETPYHRHIANTRESILRADRMGAWLVEVDPQVTADGEVVLLTEPTLGCATDGRGPVSSATLERIRELDAGFGYQLLEETGPVHPFRSEALTIPTLGEIARAIPRQARLMIHLNGDAALADAVAGALKMVERDPAAKGDAFYGTAPAIARIREIYPQAWAFTAQEARQCTADYKLTGWTGLVPASCERGTMLIALDDQALLWGWPNRLIARLESVGAKIIMEAPGLPTPGHVKGITLPEQLTEVPSSFNGYVWTDDAFTTLPALIPRFDNRTQEEIDASQAALERRRKSAAQGE